MFCIAKFKFLLMPLPPPHPSLYNLKKTLNSLFKIVFLLGSSGPVGKPSAERPSVSPAISAFRLHEDVPPCWLHPAQLLPAARRSAGKCKKGMFETY